MTAAYAEPGRVLALMMSPAFAHGITPGPVPAALSRPVDERAALVREGGHVGLGGHGRQRGQRDSAGKPAQCLVGAFSSASLRRASPIFALALAA